MDNPKIVIVGAGPTGLCAAYRLTELGYTNWKLLEGTAEPAGLACTIKDEVTLTLTLTLTLTIKDEADPRLTPNPTPNPSPQRAAFLRPLTTPSPTSYPTAHQAGCF